MESPLAAATGNQQGQVVAYGYTGTQLTSAAWGYGTADQTAATFGYSGTQLVTLTTGIAGSSPGQTWLLGYDGQGRVSSITSPVSGTAGQGGYTPAYATVFSYSPGQTVVTAGYNTPGQLSTIYTLDAAGEPVAVTDGLGHTSCASYDADHDVLAGTDARCPGSGDRPEWGLRRAHAWLGRTLDLEPASRCSPSQTWIPVANEVTITRSSLAVRRSPGRWRYAPARCPRRAAFCCWIGSPCRPERRPDGHAAAAGSAQRSGLLR